MAKYKQSKRDLKKKQQDSEKKTNRILLTIFGIMIIFAVGFDAIILNWCELKYFYRELTHRYNEIPHKYICMNGDIHKIHKTKEVIIRNKSFYACSRECEDEIRFHFDSLAYGIDPINGKQIDKSNAHAGLDVRHKDKIVYFKTTGNLKKYYSLQQYKN